MPTNRRQKKPKHVWSITWVQVDFLNGPGAQIVFFAHELVFVYHIEFLPRGQLLVTHHAGEAVQVKHLAAGFADQVVRRDSLQTARAFCAKPPGKKKKKKNQRRNPMWKLCFKKNKSEIIGCLGPHITITAAYKGPARITLSLSNKTLYYYYYYYTIFQNRSFISIRTILCIPYGHSDNKRHY